MKIKGTRMRIDKLKTILRDATRRGYFKRLDGTYTVIGEHIKVRKRRWFEPEGESTPEGMGIDAIFEGNGAK